MGKKLIITKGQFDKIKSITESTAHGTMVKNIKEFLDNSYEPVQRFVRKGGEYFEQPMVMVKLDEEIISPKDLYEYLKTKFEMGDDFTKQIIQDWMFNKISEDYQLSKNVSMR
jgi:hypothetical protein